MQNRISEENSSINSYNISPDYFNKLSLTAITLAGIIYTVADNTDDIILSQGNYIYNNEITNPISKNNKNYSTFMYSKEEIKSTTIPKSEDNYNLTQESTAIQIPENTVYQSTETIYENTIYIVKSGDNLSKIANTFGTTVEKIIETDKYITEQNKDQLRIGQEITISVKRIVTENKKIETSQSTIGNESEVPIIAKESFILQDIAIQENTSEKTFFETQNVYVVSDNITVDINKVIHGDTLLIKVGDTFYVRNKITNPFLNIKDARKKNPQKYSVSELKLEKGNRIILYNKKDLEYKRFASTPVKQYNKANNQKRYELYIGHNTQQNGFAKIHFPNNEVEKNATLGKIIPKTTSYIIIRNDRLGIDEILERDSKGEFIFYNINRANDFGIPGAVEGDEIKLLTKEQFSEMEVKEQKRREYGIQISKIFNDNYYKINSFHKKPGNCGINVRGFLESQPGIDIPNSGMNGATYIPVLNFFYKMSLFDKRYIGVPSMAEGGDTLAYKKGYGAGERYNSGHIEAVFKKNKGISFFHGPYIEKSGGSLHGDNNNYTGFNNYAYSINSSLSQDEIKGIIQKINNMSIAEIQAIESDITSDIAIELKKMKSPEKVKRLAQGKFYKNRIVVTSPKIKKYTDKLVLNGISEKMAVQIRSKLNNNPEALQNTINKLENKLETSGYNPTIEREILGLKNIVAQLV